MGCAPARSRPLVSIAAAGLSLSVALAACGGGSTRTASASSSTAVAGGSSGSTGSRLAGPADRRAIPGTSGKVAAITGASMEVQNSSGQTTVSWTSATTFRRIVTLSLSSVATGDCVAVQGTVINAKNTARSITVSSPSSSGACSSPFTGRGPGRPAAGSRATAGGFRPPSGGSSTSPAGASGAPANRADFFFVDGKVVSVSGSTILVDGTSIGRTAATDETVTTDAATRVTRQEPTSSSVLAVGDCVAAVGPTNSIGAVSASSVTITSTTSGSCTSGFGGFGRFGGGAAPAQGSPGHA
ncbi:MAG TPA: DUF5666 domain-containing protein [Acidimicrobiales bacterium]|nr:DUF5666 domain-containing protein [Acidimicrobiales bacterium]